MIFSSTIWENIWISIYFQIFAISKIVFAGVGCGNSVQEPKLKYLLRNLCICHHKYVSNSTASAKALRVNQGVSRLFLSTKDDACFPKNAQYSSLWIIIDIALFSAHCLTAGCTRARCSKRVFEDSCVSYVQYTVERVWSCPASDSVKDSWLLAL